MYMFVFMEEQKCRCKTAVLKSGNFGSLLMLRSLTFLSHLGAHNSSVVAEAAFYDK